MITQKINDITRVLRIIYRHFKSVKINIASQSCLLKLFNVYVHPSSTIQVDDWSLVSISRGVSIGAFTLIIVQNEQCDMIGRLTIGCDTYIGEFNNIRAGGATISIGKNCLISQQVSIIATNHSVNPNYLIAKQPWDKTKKGVEIDDDVWIGCGVSILPGVKIGKGAVIAAGAVVTTHVPPYSIYAGIPAKQISTRKSLN